MQTSELPDLAHTQTRPLHWLATAAAMAAVVAAAGLLQPEPEASASTHRRAAAGQDAAPAAAPDATRAEYPLDCGGLGHTVARHVPGDLDGDGRPETVAAVHCAAGSGTPPSGVYVLTRGRGGGAAPRVVATLVDPARGMSVEDLAVRDGVVSATLLGYSSADVPRCCPDQREKATWRWQGGVFVRGAGAAPVRV